MDGTVWYSSVISKTTIAPTPSNYVVTVAPATLGTGPTGVFGVDNGAGSAFGVTYQAQIATGQINGGGGRFIQLVNDNISLTDFSGNTHGVKFPSALFALDQPNTAASPFYYQYSTSLACNATTTVGGTPTQPYNESPLPRDTPGTDLIYNGVDMKSASYTIKFQTYLDYQPPGGGLHIELAVANWTVTAGVSYTGPSPPTQMDFTNPSNWDPGSPTVSVKVSTGRQLIKWSVNVTDAVKQYTF